LSAIAEAICDFESAFAIIFNFLIKFCLIGSCDLRVLKPPNASAQEEILIKHQFFSVFTRVSSAFDSTAFSFTFVAGSQKNRGRLRSRAFIVHSTMRSQTLICFLFYVFCVSAEASDSYMARVYTNTQVLPYRLLQPSPYNPEKKYPLVIFFHGAGERGTDNQKQLVHGTSLFSNEENRRRFPCFVFAPQCPEEQQWVDMPWTADSGVRPPQPSMPMHLALNGLESLLHEFSIDTNRIYVTGLSMGGFGTWDLITRFPGRFAAAAPICGGGDEHTVTPTVARVPLWTFHSADDNVVKVHRTRNMVEAMRAAGGSPKYFEYSGLGHGSWGKAYAEPEFLPWMFAQRLVQPDSYILKSQPPQSR
jgi:acetyl esterase/lipase